MVNFEGLHGVTGSQKGTGEGAQAWADFLNRFRASRADGIADLGGEGRLGEKVLAQLAKGTEAASGQDFLDPGGVQSWRLRMACSSPGLSIPCTSSEPLP